MVTIDQIETTISPYSDLLYDTVYEMLKVYPYGPNDYDVSFGTERVGIQSNDLLKESALIEPGQSTEEKVLQIDTRLLDDCYCKEEIVSSILDRTNAHIVRLIGDRFSFEFKAQITRNLDNGCAIHTTFDTKYDGNDRLVINRKNSALLKEQDVDHVADYLASAITEKFEIRDENDDKFVAFLKAVRDDNLLDGVNINNLDDGEIETAVKNRDLWNFDDVIDFIERYSGLSRSELTDKLMKKLDSIEEFDLSQLSFHFEYDIEIDEETFLSYFEIDSDEEHDAKLARSKTNVDTVKSEVLKNLEDWMNHYKARLDDTDLKDLFDEEDCSKATSISFDGSKIEVDLESSVSEIICVESEDDETGQETEHDVEIGADFSYSIDYTISEDLDEYLENFQNALDEAMESGQSTFKIEVPFEAGEEYNIEVGEIEIYDDEVDEEEVYAEAVRSIERGLANTSFEMHHGDHIQPPSDKMVRFICHIPAE